VPALMSSTPFSPWIPTSEPILRYRRIAGGECIWSPSYVFSLSEQGVEKSLASIK